MSIVETACSFGATASQVLGALESQGYKVSHDSLVRAIKAEHGMNFAEFRDHRENHTKLKLMQKAIQMGLAGNPTMLMFTLKNKCDWRDRLPDAPPGAPSRSEAEKSTDNLSISELEQRHAKLEAPN